MKKRWLLRSVFLLPLLCVVAVWVTSYFGLLSMDTYLRGHSWSAYAVEGHGGINNLPFRTPSPSLNFVRHAGWSGQATTFGFSYNTMSPMHGILLIVFPLWLPTLLLLALNWLVFRKTRPKMAGRAFPVEPDNTSAGSK